MARIKVQITTPSNNVIKVSPGVSALSSVQLYLNELIDVNTEHGADGYVLTQQADGTFAMEAVATTLADLSDTNISNPSGGDSLVYDDASQKWVPGGVKSVNGQSGDVVITIPSPPPTPGVDGLADTNITNLQDNQIIRYDSNSGNWLNEDLEALPAGGTTGQALVKATGTDYDVEWADIAIDTQYHDRFQTDAETFRSGATATTELYYTAKADGDGLAQSASSDTPTAGKVIRRKIYYSEAAFADPDTGTWVEFTPAPADDASFATVKAALLEYLKARTGGTVPISLKQTWEEVTAAPSFTGLLNESYGSGAAAAYGTRRLNGNYSGACMTIRRADGTTQTIGFVGEEIDESAITTFCTGSTCTVQVWHDQSQTGGTGSGNDATQTTPADQPTIYTGGQLVKEGGRLALDFDGSNDFFTYGIDLEPATYPNYSNYLVCTPSGQDEIAFNLTGNTNIAAITYGRTAGTFSATTYNGVTSIAKSGAHTIDTQALVESYHNFNAHTTNLYLNNNQQSGTEAGRGGTSDSYIGQQSANQRFWSGKIQEVITYQSDKTSVRTDIEGNISAYYQSAKLLDEQFGENAEAAYSTRQLRRDQTDCMVIRRASDSTTQTIGFDANGNIDEAAITTFCTGTTCTVETWKDQSSNGNDATQSTPANQPTIYTGGALVKKDGRLSVDFDGGSDILDASITIANDFTAIVTGLSTNTTNNQKFICDQTNSKGQLFVNSGNYNWFDGSTVTALQTADTSRHLFFVSADSGGSFVSIDGADQSITGIVNAGYGELKIGGRTVSSQYLDGQIQEVIMYGSDKSTDRTSIESNVGDYFTQNTPLLDTYSGAAAAYSLRKLSSSYSGNAIRVRRSSDNTEQDIGFNVFGELDTVSLLAFAGAGDAFVKTWYSQTGSNDATQTTTASQPKIVSSGAVIVENGKPAATIGVSGVMPFTSAITTAQTMVWVGKMAVFQYNRVVGNSLELQSGSQGYLNAISGTEKFNPTSISINGTNDTSSPYGSNLVGLYHSAYALGSGVGASGLQSIGWAGQASRSWRGNFQELIIYGDALTSERTEIETNINTFYSIY